VTASLIALLAAYDDGPLVPLGVMFLIFFWLYNIIDASRRAALYNQALAGVADIELPEDFKVPAFRGSILGGLVIAAAGVVLLLNTRFGVSLAWLEEWWPAALILFGGYLVWKAWQDRPRPASRLDDVG
jgi:phosphatidylserine synthase